MSRILPLDQKAISQIYSSKHITSLQGVVLALLQNSLDAKATKIDIALDFRRGNCTIEDNGLGILPNDFQEDGGLGKLHHTSKHDGSDLGELHGSTGSYLASLAALSLLTITSRRQGHEEHATLTLHNDRVVSRLVPAPRSYELPAAPSHGTQVSIRDLFGNMPVRVKQRALSGDSGSDYSKAWQEVKRGIVAFILAWAKPCSVRIRDLETSGRDISLSSHHHSISTALTEKSLNRLHGQPYKSDLRDVLPILFQSGLVARETRQRWVPVSAATFSISIKGSICLEAAPTKQCQFISFGIHPCSGESGHNELYEAVNRVFVNSSFGVTKDSALGDDAEIEKRKLDRRVKGDGYTQKQLQGRKGVDRWPMFVLQLRSRDSHQRPLLSSEASLKAVVDVLEATVKQWLATNHFRPQKHRRRKNETQSSPNVAAGSPRTIHKSGTRPGSKCAATMESQFMMKKPRTSETSDKAEYQKHDGLWQGDIGDFTGISRIRSGHGALYGKPRQDQRPETAPELHAAFLHSPKLVSRRDVLHAPPIEAGALSSTRSSASISCRHSPVHPATTHDDAEKHAERLSSEYFGSNDDMEMLEVVEAVEKQACPTHDATINDAVVPWTDPITRQVFNVNTRTGVVLPVKSSNVTGDTKTATGHHRGHAAINTSVSSTGMPLSLSRRGMRPHTPLNDAGWLPGFLKDWNNPVFNLQDEKRIPVASWTGPGLEAAAADSHRLTEQDLAQYFEQAGTTERIRLSKSGVRRATVIRQVDAKFILCVMPVSGDADTGKMLTLVDQHAASERVVLEHLLQDLCSPPEEDKPMVSLTSALGVTSAVKTTLLGRPLRFEVSGEEHLMFGTYAEHFAHWGILYDLSDYTIVPTASQVMPQAVEYRLTVNALPPVIAERCTLHPKLLIELLRSEVWSLAETSAHPKPKDITAGSDNDKHGWLEALSSCPIGVLEMLKSRACRSAIMFNDVLTVRECEKLMADLGGCAFPFMCAHGRVSMVPLIELQSNSDHGSAEPFTEATSLERPMEGVTGFVGAFKRWRGEHTIVNGNDM